MHVLVTGGAGMLGGDLVRRLADDGHDVHSIDVRPAVDLCPAGPPGQAGGVGYRHTVGDIRDTAFLTRAATGMDAVVHCASALPSYPAEQIRSIVVDGTRSVMRAARGAEVERVVHVSTTAVYGIPTDMPTAEEHPRLPCDPYSAAKAQAEEVVEEYRGTGICVPILRPKTFLGPGRLGLFAMLFEWAEEGRHFPVLGRGDVRIQMFDTFDLVDAVVTTLHAPAATADDTFNLAAAEFATLREDFQAVLDAAGHGKRVVSLPAKPALITLELLARTKLSPVYGRLSRKLMDDSYVSIDRARERLGFEPKYSNQDSLLRTYAWWREQKAAGRLGRRSGRTSRDAWRQGALALAKRVF